MMEIIEKWDLLQIFYYIRFIALGVLFMSHIENNFRNRDIEPSNFTMEMMYPSSNVDLCNTALCQQLSIS